MNDKKVCGLMLAASALVLSSLIIVEQNEQVKMPIVGETYSYSIKFDNKTNQLDFSDNITDVITNNDNLIRFAHNGVTSCDGVGVFNSQATFYNEYTKGEDIHNNVDYHNAISGLTSISVDYVGEGLTISYGWNDNYDISGDALLANANYNFSLQYPSFFKIDNLTSDSIKVNSITLNYSCAITNNPNIDNYTFSNNPDGSLQIESYTGKHENIVLPSNKDDKLVTSIASNAFKGNQIIKNVTIPKTITKIGQSAFESCPNLYEVSLGDDVISKPTPRIRKKVKSLSDFKITIEAMAFGNNTNLQYIDLPDSVNIMGGDTFVGCVKVHILYRGSEINPNWDSSWNSIGRPIIFDYAGYHGIELGHLFAYCNKDNHGFTNVFGYQQEIGSELVIPNKIFFNPVEVIDDNAFSGCKMETVVIPNSVKTIGRQTFSACPNLKEVTLPDSVETLEDHAFINCNNLTTFNSGNGLKVIPSYCFENCEKLANVHIGSSVTTIKGYAFSFNRYLREIIIPRNVINAEFRAFYQAHPVLFFENEVVPSTFDEGWCDSSSALVVLNSTDHSKKTSKDGLFTYFVGHENGVETAFLYRYVGQQQNVVIPETIDNLPVSVNYYSNLFSSWDHTFINKVEFKLQFKKLNKSFFSNFDYIEEVILPDSCKIIGKDAFRSCSSLKNIVMNKVEIIESAAFEGASLPIKFALSNTVKHVGSGAFRYIKNCNEFFIPKSVERMPDPVFEGVNPDLKIICEANSKPSGWNDNWNAGGSPVVWGVSNDNFINGNIQ